MHSDCTLVINNKKVSRLHATITVAPASPQDVVKELLIYSFYILIPVSTQANPLSVSAVTLTDSKSSFGTFVQGTRIAHSVPFTLLDGNIINFGNLATMSFK